MKKDFMWGVATSSFQIEGADVVDGKIRSIWDEFCDTPEKIKNADHARVACDHYNRFKQDFDLLDELGVGCYRFSISWPRIVAEDLKTKNQLGLDYYRRMIDNLLDRGIEPFLTLNHWDIPKVFLDRGGWTDRDCMKYFVDYADIVSREFGDVIRYWVTHNEPWVISNCGYNDGIHAPGVSSFYDSLKVNHHLLLSHGQSIPIIRSNSKDSKVGIVLNLTPGVPASSSEADKRAAMLFNQFFNDWFLDPLYGKSYPKEVADDWIGKGLFKGLDFLEDGDYDTISTPTDFLGINYYSRGIIRSEDIPESDNLPVEVIAGEKTDFDWEVFPKGLEELLVDVNKRYDLKSIYITENGCAYDYPRESDGSIIDTKRIDYLESHVEACRNAIKQGVPLDGYMHWSLMDNFEWAEGYCKRFGLVGIDFDSLERTPKDSFWRYKEIIKAPQ